MKKIMSEKVKAINYQCNYKDYNEDNYYNRTWGNAIWDLHTAFNNWSHSIYKLEVRQRGRDENNFYQNYINLYVPIDSRVDWDDYLEKLGYRFSKDIVNVEIIVVEWDENIDEYIIEVD